MSYVEHWNTLAVRIRGLREASKLSTVVQNDGHESVDYLWVACGNIVASLKAFRKSFEASLSDEVKASIDLFNDQDMTKCEPFSATFGVNQKKSSALMLVVGLSVLETEVSFLLAGRQEQIRVRSERAFLLLNRQLVVDEELRRKWQSAFDDEHEPASEKLGSVHLLSQGIYAFKINAEGARTDLIFDEPPDPAVSRSAEGLVLTEWKKAAPGNWPTQYNIAQVQADTYRRGALAGIELRDYCYLVAVSLKQLPQKGDLVSGGVRFRHINIVVDPDTPSNAAKMLGKKS